MFISGGSMFRGNSTSAWDLPPLSQCLMLVPINMGDQQHIRSGELKKALGISCGSTLEDCSFGASNLRPFSPVATEDLKRFKASVVESSVRARGRSKRLDESLHKLNKYCEAFNSKKQRKNMLPNERLSGLNMLKMGSQIHRSTSEFVSQRFEDRSKNATLNKRFRTPVAEIRAGGQNNNLRQPLVAGKDRDTLRDGAEGCDFVEEKIRRLPAGETWDKKMKRKRSMSTGFPRSIDGEGEQKRVYLKINSESGLQSSNTQGLRSGSSGNNSKLDLSSLPASSNGRATAKNDQEKVHSDSVDGSNKERVILRGNKFNARDDNYIGGAYPLTKGKASRVSRTGPLVAANSSIASRSSEALGSWERPSKMIKHQSLCGNNNRKRPLPTGSSPPSMAQWVGQRPQKISRTRRVNVVSPVLNTDEVQMPLECCSPSYASTRMTPTAMSGSLFSMDAANGIQRGRVKLQNGSLPPMLSESEEPDAVESKLKEKGLESCDFDEKALTNSQNISSSVLATRKNKMPGKEEIGDGLRRQRRTNRGSSILRASFSPSKDKFEATTLIKPLKITKPISEKNGSTSGWVPLKNSSDRKSITRVGLLSTGDSPDLSAESEDDREELLDAANFASNSSYAGCSSTFWKKLEPIFAPVNLANVDYLKQLVKSMEEDQGLAETVSLTNDVSDGLLLKNRFLSQCQKVKSISSQMNAKEISSMLDIDGQHLDSGFLHTQVDSAEIRVAPLYQRVLAAIVLEDQVDETDDSLDIEPKSMIGAEFESHCASSPQLMTQCASDVLSLSCNRNIIFTNGLNIHDQELDDLLPVHQGPLHSGTELFPKLSKNGSGGLLAANMDSSHSLSFDCQFEKMSLDDKILLELQSIGLYPDAVPDLADGDSEPIDQDVIHLQKSLDQQVCKKREYLTNLIQEIEKVREMEQRSLEPVAMGKLIELAYKKKLATRGSNAARNGEPKVSKQVASAFMKRTLARCRKFEDAGRSCFMDPMLKDVLFATRADDNYADSVAAINLPQSQNSEGETTLLGFIPCREQSGVDNDQIGSSPVDLFDNLNQLSDHDFTRTVPMLNRGKKKELLLDDVGDTASLRSAPILSNSFVGGAKGKRGERERDKDPSGRNSVAKTGLPSTGYSRGERKTKAKPKQNSAQLSASVNGSLGKFPGNTDSEHRSAGDSGKVNDNGNTRQCKIESVSHGFPSNNLSMELGPNIDFTNLHEFDSLELAVDNELNEHQDLGSWLNIDDENLQDHDAVGLDIPMDDLSELNMF